MEKRRTIQVLEELLSYTQMNARQLNAKLGYASPNWLYETLSPDRGAGLSKQRAERIAEVFPEISLSYLLTGEGTLLKADTIEGNIQTNINSSHITQHGNIEAPVAQMDKLIGVLAEQSQQVTKAQEQIDRLITLLERNSKN